uniref:Hypoxia inducible factor 1 subunit alpha, like n=1 Tax=Scleropages formosus TaxID=113540 RepID=A0A8C9W3B4_SCLFO
MPLPLTSLLLYLHNSSASCKLFTCFWHPFPYVVLLWVFQCSGEDQFMDKDSVEKFFTFKPVDTNQESTAESMDLDMLAPYISMDDDFQLTFFTQLPESDLSSPESPVPGARKRALEDDVETSFRGILKDKRQRHTAVEEEVLLDAEPPDELEPVPHHNKLLTDRDPILGGVQELRDPPALMSTMLSPQHDQPDLKKSSVKTLT